MNPQARMLGNHKMQGSEIKDEVNMVLFQQFRIFAEMDASMTSFILSALDCLYSTNE